MREKQIIITAIISWNSIMYGVKLGHFHWHNMV